MPQQAKFGGGVYRSLLLLAHFMVFGRWQEFGITHGIKQSYVETSVGYAFATPLVKVNVTVTKKVKMVSGQKLS
jgi:hypothetical protein